MTPESTTFSVESYHAAIIVLGAVPVTDDLQSPTAFALLQDQFNQLVAAGGGGGGGGWTIQSKQTFPPATNAIPATGGTVLFPSGPPYGVIDDAVTPDGTLFRFRCGGIGFQTGLGGNMQIALSPAAVPSFMFAGFIRRPAGGGDFSWSAQFDGIVSGAGAARVLKHNGFMTVSQEPDLASPFTVQAGSGFSDSIPTAVADVFELYGRFDYVDAGAFMSLDFAVMEYFV